MILFTGKLYPKDLPVDLPNDLNEIVCSWRDRKSLIIQTSGSTGKPKAIVLPKKLVHWSANQSKAAMRLTNDEKVLLCIPFTKVGGQMLLIRSILFKWHLQVQEATANPLLHIPEKHSFTMVSLVPYQLASILEDAGSTNKLKRFKTVLIGGAGLSKVLEQDVQEFLHSCKTEMFHSYGMTETASHVALRNMRIMKPNTFKLLDGVTVNLTKSDCMQFTISEIDWEVKTKDIGKVKDRIITFLSRNDEVVNSGGVKLNIHDVRLKIDKELEEKDLLIRFFLWKQLDDALGEKLVLIGISSDRNNEVEKVLKDTLPKYDVPKVFYWTDVFDRKESGKIDRQKTLQRLIEVGG